MTSSSSSPLLQRSVRCCCWAVCGRPQGIIDTDSNSCLLKSGGRALGRLTIWFPHPWETYTVCVSLLVRHVSLRVSRLQSLQQEGGHWYRLNQDESAIAVLGLNVQMRAQSPGVILHITRCGGRHPSPLAYAGPSGCRGQHIFKFTFTSFLFGSSVILSNREAGIVVSWCVSSWWMCFWRHLL